MIRCKCRKDGILPAGCLCFHGYDITILLHCQQFFVGFFAERQGLFSFSSKEFHNLWTGFPTPTSHCVIL